ncbi:MFS transporter [Acidicapsa acidisoli]|uniref:MFS transporter n=1 Tax=Acidicapsa acidisoli TaxID=1615681 RepID=UPI0021E0637B|nr:MFS transporter [Acidicapsa acidisoli]
MAQTYTDLTVSRDPSTQREALLRILSAAAFLVFFQTYLVAPLIPALAVEFHASTNLLGMLVPAYMLPYGISTLFYGPLSDRVGRKPVILTLLVMMVVTTVGVATAGTVHQMLAWRILGGVATGGIVPIALALLGDLFPYAERGRPIGWMFGAMAGGMAFGSSVGAFLNPIIGWRKEFLITAFLSGITLAFAVRLRHSFESKLPQHPLSAGALISGYMNLFSDPRAAKGYIYVLLNGIFHSGVFSWLGLYFSQRYHLGDEGIGLALLGYGIPGMLLGPIIGHVADRYGRKRIIPLGIVVAAVSAAALIPRSPLLVRPLIIAALSLGYDMSHPLLTGIITSVNPARRGLAMGMNAFVLFSGFGLGTLIFEVVLRSGFTISLAVFAAAQLCLGFLAIPLFSGEDSSVGDQLHTVQMVSSGD